MAERRIVLPIKGMECGTCAGVVERRLAGNDGVRDVRVNFTTGEATVDVVEGGPLAADLVKAVREVGYDCAGATVTFEVAGLHHASSVTRLEREIAKRPGVLRASANQTTELLEVQYLPGLVSPRDLEQVISAVGLSIAEPVPEPGPIDWDMARCARATRGLGWRFAIAAVATVIIVIGSMPLHAEAAVRGSDVLVRILHSFDAFLRGVLPPLYGLDPLWLKLGCLAIALVVLLYSGRPFLAAAWQGFRHHSADANTLVAAASGVAFLYSVVAVVMTSVVPTSGLPPDVYFEAVTGIIAFAVLGRLIELRANAQTTGAVHELMSLQPSTATVRRDGASREVAAHQICIGDRVPVSPGQSIPVDGTIVAGDSDVDMSMFYGAPDGVAVGPGSRARAGAVNRTALLEMEAATTSRTSMVGQTVRAVQEAPFRKGPVQRRADRLTGMVAPVVIAVALGVVVAWLLLGGVSNW